jgi:hypothetical protein
MGLRNGDVPNGIRNVEAGAAIRPANDEPVLSCGTS